MKYIRIRYVHKETGEVRVDYKAQCSQYGDDLIAETRAATTLQWDKHPGEFTADFRKEVTYEEE